jgi:hypothetical protein
MKSQSNGGFVMRATAAQHGAQSSSSSGRCLFLTAAVRPVQLKRHSGSL